jgi:hypothetical protein
MIHLRLFFNLENSLHWKTLYIGKLFRWKHCLNGKLASIEKQIKLEKKCMKNLHVLKNYVHWKNAYIEKLFSFKIYFHF